jgi:hypothetical protein
MPPAKGGLLALIGAPLMTALLVWTFVLTLLNVLRGLVPAATLFRSFIYAFGCFADSADFGYRESQIA